MHKTQFTAVQGMGLILRTIPAVHFVTSQRMSKVSKVHPNLMRPSGFQPNLYLCVFLSPRQHFIIGHCPLAGNKINTPPDAVSVFRPIGASIVPLSGSCILPFCTSATYSLFTFPASLEALSIFLATTQSRWCLRPVLSPGEKSVPVRFSRNRRQKSCLRYP